MDFQSRVVQLRDQPLDKVGVYAVRENPVLYHNLIASLDETYLEIYIYEHKRKSLNTEPTETGHKKRNFFVFYLDVV